MRSMMLSIILSFALGAGLAMSARAEDPTQGGGEGGPPADCSYNGGPTCGNPNGTCATLGGTCTANGSGSRWHDANQDGCGCLI